MPSPEYLAAINGQPAPAPVAPLASFAPPPVAPAALQTVPVALPPMGPPPAPPVDAGPMYPTAPPVADPNAYHTPPMSPRPEDMPPPAAPTAGYEPHKTYLRQVAGGSYTAPAHETELRGPQLKAQEAVRNAAVDHAIVANNDRTQNAVIDEKLMFQAQADAALARQDAQQRADAAHADEMAQRSKDFDASVKALSAQSIDPGRYWANAGTGLRIGAIASAGFGGFLAGMTGNSNNPALDAINMAVDRDIKAQEMAYQATRDTMNAKQTAFSMAMHKYGDENAARAAVRASAMDVVQAQLGQQAALWKGTEAANRADIASASLEADKQEQIRQGVAFTTAKTVTTAPSFIDPRTGITYSNKEAQGVQGEVDKEEHAVRMVGATTAGHIIEDANKPKPGAEKDTGERTVVIDGEKRLALSKDKAEKWDKYNHSRAVFGDALKSLKAARAEGNVGEYNSARATLIETYPELLGYSRAPTEGQISVTVGPEAIPEYNHWFEPSSILTGGAVYGVKQNRGQEKIGRLDSVVRESDKAMKENTFGETTAAPASLKFDAPAEVKK